MGPLLDPTPEKWLAYFKMLAARWEAYIASPKFAKRSQSEQGAICTELRICETQIAKYEQEVNDAG